jgi:hypothetical protein
MNNLLLFNWFKLLLKLNILLFISCFSIFYNSFILYLWKSFYIFIFCNYYSLYYFAFLYYKSIYKYNRFNDIYYVCNFLCYGWCFIYSNGILYLSITYNLLFYDTGRLYSCYRFVLYLYVYSYFNSYL